MAPEIILYFIIPEIYTHGVIMISFKHFEAIRLTSSRDIWYHPQGEISIPIKLGIEMLLPQSATERDGRRTRSKIIISPRLKKMLGLFYSFLTVTLV